VASDAPITLTGSTLMTKSSRVRMTSRSTRKTRLSHAPSGAGLMRRSQR